MKNGKNGIKVSFRFGIGTIFALELLDGSLSNVSPVQSPVQPSINLRATKKLARPNAKMYM